MFTECTTVHGWKVWINLDHVMLFRLQDNETAVVWVSEDDELMIREKPEDVIPTAKLVG